MKKCPSCGKEVQENLQECPFCGIFFSKWEARHSVRNQAPLAPGPVTPPQKKSSSGIFILLPLVAVIAAGAYFLFTPASKEKDCREAFLSYYSALSDGDADGIKKHLCKKALDGVNQAGPMFNMLAPMLKAFAPKDVSVKKITLNGDSAIVETYVGKNSEDVNKTEMVLEDGSWKVVRMGIENTVNMPRETMKDMNESMEAYQQRTPDTMPQAPAPQQNQPVPQFQEDAAPGQNPAPAAAQSAGGNDYSKMNLAELNSALANSDSVYEAQKLANEYVKRGLKEQVKEIFCSMLKNKAGGLSENQLQHQLRLLKLPVSYDSFEPGSTDSSAENGIGLAGFSAEIRGSSLYCSGRVILNDEAYSGMSKIPTSNYSSSGSKYAKYTITVTDGNSQKVASKVYNFNFREASWADLEMASGLNPGKYEVRCLMEAQYVENRGNLRYTSRAQHVEVEK